MKARRTDEQRRASLKLMNLRHEADRLAYQRDQLRRELAAVVRRPGPSRTSPEVVELEARLWPIIHAWEAVSEQIRAHLQEDAACR